jgi:hypothetical protein
VVFNRAGDGCVVGACYPPDYFPLLDYAAFFWESTSDVKVFIVLDLTELANLNFDGSA